MRPFAKRLSVFLNKVLEARRFRLSASGIKNIRLRCVHFWLFILFDIVYIASGVMITVRSVPEACPLRWVISSRKGRTDSRSICQPSLLSHSHQLRYVIIVIARGMSSLASMPMPLDSHHPSHPLIAWGFKCPRFKENRVLEKSLNAPI